MDEEEVILDPTQKQELAGIIKKMEAAKESPENIKAVVARYNEKNAKKSQPTASQSGGGDSFKPRLPKDSVTKIPAKVEQESMYNLEDPMAKPFSKESNVQNKKIQDEYKKQNPNLKQQIKAETAEANKQALEAPVELTDYDRESPYAQYSKRAVTYEKKGEDILEIETEADDFVSKYFGKDKLQAIGIDPKDFDGFLEVKELKDGFRELDNKGFFTEAGSKDYTGGSTFNPDLARDMHKLNLINKYFEERIRPDKKAIAHALKMKNSGVENSDALYDTAMKSLQTKTQGYVNFINENLPDYVSHEESKKDKLKEQYKNYKEGNGERWSNGLKGAYEGVIQSIHGLTATVYDKLGFDDTATQLRLQKEQEQRYSSVPDLYYSNAKGKKVVYNGTNYLYNEETGDVFDVDDKLRATAILEGSDYSKIKNLASQSKEEDESFSFGGTMQMTSGVIGDMAVQLLLTRGVGSATSTLGKIATVGAGEIGALGYVENILSNATIAKTLSSPIANTLTKIPAVYGDVLITQGAYGYSNGYENTYQAMIEAGKSDIEAKTIANEAGTEMAKLYAATSFIAPQIPVLQALEGNTVKSLIRRAIPLLEKEGVEGFRQALQVGSKNALTTVKNSLANARKGAAIAVSEGGKEVVQENIQQYGETTMVNKDVNELAGENLLKDTYTLEDFKNTTALAFSAALVMNSPSMFRGTDKLDILSKLNQNYDNFNTSLDHYVAKGLATAEQAKALKNDVLTFKKYSNQIPPKTNNTVAFEAMKKLEAIDNITVQMENVHSALKDTYKERIEKEKAELKQLLNVTETESTSSQEGQNNQGETKATKETDQVVDSGIITDRNQDWDNNTKSTLPESRFETEEDFKETVKSGTWGMLTAENPNIEQVSDDTNFNNNEKAIEWLKGKGYNPQPIFGKYGNSENSFFVEDLTKEDAVEFAKEFKQESVATNEGLVYQDGTMSPKVSESFKAGEDNYSSIKVGDKLVDYSVKYDLDNKVDIKSIENDGIVEVAPDENPVEKYKEVADKIRSAKFYKNPSDAMKRLNTDITAPLKFAWDTTMEVIATSVEQSGNLTQAINKGVKHLKSTDWYKTLTNENKAKAIETLTNEATTNLTPLAKSVVPKSKSSTKSTVRKTTGQTDTSRKVETTESKLLKLKLKTAEQAQRVQRSFDNKNRTAAVANLRQLVETLSKNGTVNPAILKSMLKGAVKLNTSNPEAVAKFMERVNKVISKINDRAKLVEVKKLKRDANRLPKTAPANVRELGKAANGINEKYLSPADLQTFADVLLEIKNSNTPVQGSKQKMVDVDAAYNTLQTLVDNAEANRLEEIKDSMELLGIDLADLNMTDSQLRDFWDTELNIDGATLEEKKQESLDKANALKDKLKEIAEMYSLILSGFDFDTIKTPKSKEVAKQLNAANLEYMEAVALKEYIKAVQNLVTNGSLAGAGKIASEIKSTNGMVKFITNVIKSGVPLGSIKIDTKAGKGNFLNDLKSLSLMMKEVYKKPELMGEFNFFSGLDALSKGQVSVDRDIDVTTRALDDLFKSLLPKNKNLRNSDNTMLRGVVANLIQGNTKEELEINKARIEDHIKKDDKYSNEVQSIYNEFKGFETQQEILDHLKSKNDGNYELVTFWLDKFKSIKEDLKENTEVVHNEIFNEVAENYLPIKIKVEIGSEIDEGGSSFNYGGITAPKQSTTTMKRNKSKKLPKNGMLDLDFDAAMINRLKRGLNDIHTSSSMQQIRSFFGSKQIVALMGKNNTSTFIKRVNYMQKLGAGSLNETSDVERAVSKVEKVFKRIGVTAALGGLTAIVKQTVPVMTQVAVQVGTKNFGSFISNFRVSQNNQLLQSYSTSMRGQSLLGTKSIADSASDLNRYKGFTGGVSNVSRKFGQFFDKTRNVLMKPLQLGDEAVAKAAWTTYYLEYLKKNGVDVSQIDISKEHEFIDNDEMRQRAASYAEVRVEETQVASNNERSASLFNNPHVGVAALRSIFLPFQQFNINSKMRMILDISEIMNTRKNGKLAQKVNNMTTKEMIESVMNGEMLNNAHTTMTGRNSSLTKSIRSLGATITEQIMFQGIKAYALTLFTSHSAALFKFLVDDDDESKEHEEWLDKEIDWQFKTKQFYSNLTKDLNPLLIGNFMEDEQIDLLNRFHYLFGNEEDEFQTYKQWANAYKKENGSLPFYTFENKGKNVYGIYSIPVDIGRQVLINGDFAMDGEAYITNDWGKEEQFILDNKSQLRFMRMMFVMECLRATTGVEADSYRELEKVRKELVKTSKVKK